MGISDKEQIRKKTNYDLPIRTVIYRKKNNISEKNELRISDQNSGKSEKERQIRKKRTSDQNSGISEKEQQIRKKNYEFPNKTVVYRKKNNTSEKN